MERYSPFGRPGSHRPADTRSKKERRFPFWFEVSLARRMTHIPPQAFPAWGLFFAYFLVLRATHTTRNFI
uniref:Uncharacterized protein n=1 Tax=mine drainage metagenome TaxID=410659 RepID=E6QVQ9_9ZZZZ